MSSYFTDEVGFVIGHYLAADKQDSARYTQRQCMFCGDVISPYTTIGKSDPNTNPMALVAHDKCATVGERVCVAFRMCKGILSSPYMTP